MTLWLRLYGAVGGPHFNIARQLVATSSRNSRSSCASGSPQMPVCTSDGWMIVLDGATSQWKRAVMSSCAIGPARRVARGDALDRLEVGAHRVGVEVGRERGAAAARRAACARQVAERPAEDDHADVDPLAALDPRHDAERSRRRTGYPPTGLLGLGDERARRLEPRREVVDVAPRSSPSSHASGTAAAICLEQLARDAAARAARRRRRSSRRTAAARGRRSRSNGRRACSRRSPAPWWK